MTKPDQNTAAPAAVRFDFNLPLIPQIKAALEAGGHRGDIRAALAEQADGDEDKTQSLYRALSDAASRGLDLFKPMKPIPPSLPLIDLAKRAKARAARETTATADAAPMAAAHWIQTFHGLAEPFDLQPDQIVITNIARSLGNQCRYNGHVKRFYSVALHSVAVMKLAEVLGLPLEAQLWALLHDAGESFGVGDISSPVKKHPVFTSWRKQEAAIDVRLRAHFKLDLSPAMLGQIATLDLALLTPEREDLLNKSPREWNPLPQIPEALTAYLWAWSDMIDQAGPAIHTSEASAAAYLWHFARLSAEIAGRAAEKMDQVPDTVEVTKK